MQVSFDEIENIIIKLEKVCGSIEYLHSLDPQLHVSNSYSKILYSNKDDLKTLNDKFFAKLKTLFK